MGNIISFEGKISSENEITLSNGAMNTFINILALSTSSLAKTISEKQISVWLCEKDQTLGLGTVGFDITEIPWDKNTFDTDKLFLLKSIDSAINKTGWDVLDYEPNMEIILPKLNQFKSLIQMMNKEMIISDCKTQWLNASNPDEPINCGFPKCKKHGIFMTFLGCQICNS